MTTRIVVAISGEVSAGKTTAGYYLKKLGFGYTRISWAIRKDLRGHGEPEPTRRRYQERGMELHRQNQRNLCKRAVIMLPPYCFHFVVDGLRWKEDVDFFRERYGAGLVHLHVLASEELRRTRFESRDKDVPFDEANCHEVEQEVPLIGSLADATITNEGGRKAFYKMIREAVELERYAR
jgi:dephospho-CoA kinase